MTTLLDKNDVLTGLFASWDAIGRLLDGLPDDDWDAPTSLPGWQVRDVLAHIAGTEAMLLGMSPAEPDVDVSTLDHVHNPIGALNERWVRHLRAESAPAVLERFHELNGRRRSMLTKMIPEAWNALTQTPAGPDTYGRFMRIRVFDCWMHEQDIRDALNRPSTDAELGGDDTRVALDEVVASMGFVIGKKGGAPDGARILIELNGPVARSIRVSVQGRAEVVEDFWGPEPTTTISLDGLQFTRLCGGRPMTPARPQAIDYDGDVAVGERIVSNLSYVI
ncbi:MAG TPA: maleylpyruvate isomerase family mycothiol-dependent enzyme [Mycobacterium sp.]|nr:maleylpyruvate isomerase family mycothiol-dependent enzyme [Mycobacterium sp.]